jgi:hypothetical protein
LNGRDTFDIIVLKKLLSEKSLLFNVNPVILWDKCDGDPLSTPEGEATQGEPP